MYRSSAVFPMPALAPHDQNGALPLAQVRQQLVELVAFARPAQEARAAVIKPLDHWEALEVLQPD